MPTVGSAVDDAARRLEQAGVPRARSEASRLLAWLLGTDRGGVVARRPDPLPSGTAVRLGDLVARRQRREPLQYLTGAQEFFGLSFAVDRRVMIPRTETEGLVEAVLRLSLGTEARIVDVGTGTGCIAIALASRRPEWRITAIDVAEGALEVARENAARHAVASKIRFLRAELADLSRDEPSSLDVVVSNPPYVSESEWLLLEPEVREYEPKVALVPGPTGLEAYRSLVPAAFRAMKPGGFLALELGYRSEPAAREAVHSAGFAVVKVLPDLRGIPRILMARRPETEESGSK